MRKRTLVIRCTHEQDEKHSFEVVHNLFSTRPREKEGIQLENTVGRSLERPKQRRSMKCEARQQKLAEAYDELLVMNLQLEPALLRWVRSFPYAPPRPVFVEARPQKSGSEPLRPQNERVEAAPELRKCRKRASRAPNRA